MSPNRPPPSFRLAAPEDRAVLDTMIREYYAYDRHPADDKIIAAALDGALAPNHHIRIWVIEVDGEAAGYMAVAIGFTIEAGGNDGFLDELYLRKAFRGRGIGRQAVEFAIAACPSLGIRRLSLEVERHNARAKRLYEDIGFEAHDRILMSHWTDGRERT
jgi:ribosomal protein S18 acetylase RimI-like enzyme